jgi:deoxyadenosine/deoxycytidine kinase
MAAALNELLLELPAVRMALVSGFVFHEGIIGVGKSTLLAPFCDQLAAALGVDRERVVSVQEPVELWKASGALKAFYANIADEAVPFQHFTHVTRLQSYIDAVSALPARLFLEPQNGVTVVVVCERSVIADALCFMRMLCDGDARLVRPHHVTMYLQWWMTWAQLMPLRRMAFVYWRPAFDVVMARMRARNRGGEVSAVDRDYQQRLAEQHDRVFGVADQSMCCDPAALIAQWGVAHAARLTGMAAGPMSDSPPPETLSCDSSDSEHAEARPADADDALRAALHQHSVNATLAQVLGSVLSGASRVFVGDNSPPMDACSQWLAPAVEFAVREIRAFAAAAH